MTDTICRCPVLMEKDLAHWSRLLSWVTTLILRVVLTAFFSVLSICQERCHPSNCKERSCRQGEAGGHSWLGPGPGVSYLASGAPWCSPGWSGHLRKSRRWTSHRGQSGDQKTAVGVGRPHTCRGARDSKYSVKVGDLILRLALRCVFNTGQASSGGEAR